MMQAALLGNPDTKRTIYLERAARQEGMPLLFVDWKDWKRVFLEKELFLKIDPPLWRSCSLEELDRLTEEYTACLEELSRRAESRRIVFFNTPWAIQALLDKRFCKRRLMQAGLPVTEPLAGCVMPAGGKERVGEALQAGCPLLSAEGKERAGTEPPAGHVLPAGQKLSAGQLLEIMREWRVPQVFLKPVRGSGAAGVSAFRWQPASGKMALYTCALKLPDAGLVYTKRLRRFSEPGEVLGLLDSLLSLDCMVERWYAKAEYQGFSYDLRAVAQDGQVDFLLARLSKGPITNLHLNNRPLEADALGLPEPVWDSIKDICRRSMECFPGLRSAGIDILLEKGSLRPRIIEMNGQGDLIYQDIYHENIIYRRQVEMMGR